MIVKCADCGKEFVTYPYRIRDGRGKYCSRECSDRHTLIKKGQHLVEPKGWRWHQARKEGGRYKEIHKPDHPFCNKAGYIREHRLIMEEKLGRPITKQEIVHHIDGNTENNDIDNLQLMTKSEHLRHHLKDNVHKRWKNRK